LTMSDAISEEETRKVASLAKLALSADELALYRAQLSRVLEHVRELESLDVEGVEEAVSASAAGKALRADDPVPAANAADYAALAPSFADGHFRVPKVVE